MSETQYWDCIIFKRTKADKIFPVRIGSAKPRTDGQGFNIYLDALPPNGEFAVVPQRERKVTRQAEPSNWDAPLDDSIPAF